MIFRILTALALASAASARIVGLAAPKTIVANENFTITLITENYIQSVKDLVAAFALTPRVDPSGYIGTGYLGSFYLGPDKSNVLGNLTFEVTAPADKVGTYLSGVVTSLYGASNGATTIQWGVPITYSDEVSSDQVASTDGNNVCSTGSPSDPGSGGGSSNNTTSAPPSGSTTPPASGDCFPTSTQTLIQSSLVYSNALIDSIVQSNNQTGRQNLGELNGFLGDLSTAVGVGRGGESCNNPSLPAWPPLSPSDSQVRAISILRNAQSALQAEQGAILECNQAQAKNIQCQVLRLVDNLKSYYS